MCAYSRIKSCSDSVAGVGSAVGMADSRWYVAIVKNNTEKSVRDKLEQSGYECYLPLQKELRIWKNGKRAVIERVVIPTVVFIHCTEPERKSIVSLPYIIRFLSNRAGVAANNYITPLAVIPDHQIEQLRFMVGNSDTPINFTSRGFLKGDKVKVIRGKLAGLEGHVHAIDAKRSEIIISLDCLGSARLVTDTINIEPLPTQK